MKNACIAALLLLSSGLTFAQSQGEIIDRIIGVIGDEIILQSELENDLIQQQMSGVDLDGGAKCTSFEQLLFQNLLLNQARIDSLFITEAQIQSTIDQRLDYFISLFGSVEAFETEYGKSIAQWRDDFHDPIEEQLLVEQMRGSIDQSVSATPKAVQDYYNSFPIDSLPLISEQIKYSVIAIQPEATEEEKERLLVTADSVRKLVANKELTFSIAALRFSKDPGSKYKGGLYENVRKGMFVPEFEAAAYSTPVNEISPVFETDFGYHFLMPTDIRGEVYSARHVLFSHDIDEKDLQVAYNLADSLALAIQVDSLTFEKAAIAYSTDEETSNQGGKVSNFQQGGMKHNVDDLERDIFLALNNLKVEEISVPIIKEDPSGNPYYVIYQLDGRISAHVANLQDDYLMFKQQCEAEMRQAAFEKWVAKRINSTYVRLNDDYKDCTFEFPWFPAGM
ncbi:MAG: peptidylprolyl isomerase [Flavobacteriales bacterium]|nr:peptidylprolyl isomerase [Flavobacteriales bacterium]MDG1780200.1 peptidylprolyl isomerase [Flavobacteriales bacterium]MDG2247428.1 peptidylprolyl isomerase [Flavobacteriales bacterium]